MGRILKSNRFDEELWNQLQELSARKQMEVSKLLDIAIRDVLKKYKNAGCTKFKKFMKRGTLRHYKGNTWHLQICTGIKNEKGKSREKVYTIKANSLQDAEEQREEIANLINQGIIP